MTDINWLFTILMIVLVQAVGLVLIAYGALFVSMLFGKDWSVWWRVFKMKTKGVIGAVIKRIRK